MLGISLALPSVRRVAGGTPPYNPASVFGANLRIWFDFGDTSRLWQDTVGGTPCSANGQPIGAVEDKSGNGQHATQATAGAKPTRLDVGGLMPTQASFDGGDRLLTPTFTSIPQAFTLVIVGNVTNNNGALTDSAAPRTILQRGASVSTLTIHNGVSLTASAVSPDLSVARAFFAEYNGVSASKSYVNNILQATGSAGTLGCTNLSVGGIPGNLMIGQMGELMLIDRLMTSQERSDLFSNYLQIRWGLLCSTSYWTIFGRLVTCGQAPTSRTA